VSHYALKAGGMDKTSAAAVPMNFLAKPEMEHGFDPL
jgi:hypothetical protein